jgi:hypothetical protein
MIDKIVTDGGEIEAKKPVINVVTNLTEAFMAFKKLEKFMNRSQITAMVNAILYSDSQWVYSKLVELLGIVQQMPSTYETDEQGADAIVYLHYFMAGCDWYITEKDANPDQQQAFGWADIGCGEYGYISIEEIIAGGADLDLFWDPVPVGSIANSAD